MTDVSIKQEETQRKKVHEGGGRDRGMQPGPGDWKPPETVSKEGPFSGAIRETRPCWCLNSSFWTPKLRQFGYLLWKPLSLWKCVTATQTLTQTHSLPLTDSSTTWTPLLICFRIFLSKDSDTLKQSSNHPHLKQCWVHLLKWLSDLTRLLLSHLKLANYPLTKLFSNNPWGLQRRRLILPGCSPKPLYFISLHPPGFLL